MSWRGRLSPREQLDHTGRQSRRIEAGRVDSEADQNEASGAIDPDILSVVPGSIEDAAQHRVDWHTPHIAQLFGINAPVVGSVGAVRTALGQVPSE